MPTDTGSGNKWRRLSLDGADGVELYVNDEGVTATRDYAPTAGGPRRHMVTVRGRTGPPNLLVLAEAAHELVPGVPMAFAPAQFWNGDMATRVAIETTDTVLSDMWLSAVAGDDRE